MTWASLKSLMARRTRAALTALAVVLGVAMIAGSLILLALLLLGWLLWKRRRRKDDEDDKGRSGAPAAMPSASP